MHADSPSPFITLWCLTSRSVLRKISEILGLELLYALVAPSGKALVIARLSSTSTVCTQRQQHTSIGCRLSDTEQYTTSTEQWWTSYSHLLCNLSSNQTHDHPSLPFLSPSPLPSNINTLWNIITTCIVKLNSVNIGLKLASLNIDRLLTETVVTEVDCYIEEVFLTVSYEDGRRFRKALQYFLDVLVNCTHTLEENNRWKMQDGGDIEIKHGTEMKRCDAVER